MSVRIDAVWMAVIISEWLTSREWIRSEASWKIVGWKMHPHCSWLDTVTFCWLSVCQCNATQTQPCGIRKLSKKSRNSGAVDIGVQQAKPSTLAHWSARSAVGQAAREAQFRASSPRVRWGQTPANRAVSRSWDGKRRRAHAASDTPEFTTVSLQRDCSLQLQTKLVCLRFWLNIRRGAWGHRACLVFSSLFLRVWVWLVLYLLLYPTHSSCFFLLTTTFPSWHYRFLPTVYSILKSLLVYCVTTLCFPP